MRSVRTLLCKRLGLTRFLDEMAAETNAYIDEQAP